LTPVHLDHGLMPRATATSKDESGGDHRGDDHRTHYHLVFGRLFGVVEDPDDLHGLGFDVLTADSHDEISSLDLANLEATTPAAAVATAAVTSLAQTRPHSPSNT